MDRHPYLGVAPISTGHLNQPLVAPQFYDSLQPVVKVEKRKNSCPTIQTAIAAICLSVCIPGCKAKNKAPPPKKSEAREKVSVDSKTKVLMYDDAATILRDLDVEVKSLGDRCIDLVWWDDPNKGRENALPTSLSGVFKLFEGKSISKEGSCTKGDSRWSCEVTIANGDSFSVQVKFNMDAALKVDLSTIQCSMAG